MRAIHDNFVDLQRMFAGFAQLGVLAAWDRRSPRRQGRGLGSQAA